MASALSPADVIVRHGCCRASKACRVIVPDDQLSLAIGKEGQNARLAARLTGYKIDIQARIPSRCLRGGRVCPGPAGGPGGGRSRSPGGSSRRRSTGRCTRGRRRTGRSHRICRTRGGTRRINHPFDHPGRRNLRAEKNTHAAVPRLSGNEAEERADPRRACAGRARVSIDSRGKSPGRGAYVCPNTACLQKALRSKALDRSLEVEIPQEIYETLIAQMEASRNE